MAYKNICVFNISRTFLRVLLMQLNVFTVVSFGFDENCFHCPYITVSLFYVFSMRFCSILENRLGLTCY